MTYPKCKYCANPRMPMPGDHWYEANGVAWCRNMCGTCIDVEFCCNVSKDLYDTKRMAAAVAKDYSMSEDVIARLGG